MILIQLLIGKGSDVIGTHHIKVGLGIFTLSEKVLQPMIQKSAF